MRTRWNSSLLVPVCAVLGTGVLATANAAQQVEPKVSPIFKTSAWVTRQVVTLLLRERADRSLLLTVQDWNNVAAGPAAHGPVYEYQPQTNEFRTTPSESWDRATGPIMDCSRPPVGEAAFRLDSAAGTLSYKGQGIQSKGRSVVGFTLSPNQTSVAVLSAAGPKKHSIMPFLGGGANARGRHYHEVLQLPAFSSNARRQARLPFTTARVAWTGCWSADERFVVYTSVLYDELCIISIVD